jgi:5-hydroxyisourate hydrolase
MSNIDRDIDPGIDLNRREFVSGGLLDEAVSRRDFLAAGLALGALAALPMPADAQAPADGRITVHVLDTYAGRPGGGMRVDLSVQDGSGWKLVKSAMTVASGRTADPLMSGASMLTGNFMLEFFHAEYFRRGAFLPQPPFYDRVTHYFPVPTLKTNYHITIVTAPWGYTTGRWKE